MSSTTTTDPSIPNVRELIDSGTFVDFIEEARLVGNLAEEIVTNRRLGKAPKVPTLDELNETYAKLLDSCLEAGQTVDESHGLPTMYRWELVYNGIVEQIIAEGLEDEVEALLPADVRQNAVDQADSTLGLEWLVEVVEPKGGYRCGVTGQDRTGKAVHITPRWYGDREANELVPIFISPEIIAGLDL